MVLFKIPNSIVKYDIYSTSIEESLDIVNDQINDIKVYIRNKYKENNIPYELKFGDMIHVGDSMIRDEGLFIYNGKEFENLMYKDDSEYGYIPDDFKLFEKPYFLTFDKVFKYMYDDDKVYVNAYMIENDESVDTKNFGPWKYSMVWDDKDYIIDIYNNIKIYNHVPYSIININMLNTTKKVLIIYDFTILEDDLYDSGIKLTDDMLIYEFKKSFYINNRYSYRLHEYEYEDSVNYIINNNKHDYVVYKN